MYLESLPNNVTKEAVFCSVLMVITSRGYQELLVRNLSQHHFTRAYENVIGVLQSLVMIILQHYNK